MDVGIVPRRLLPLVIPAALLVFGGRATGAEPICVVCSGPDATYRCELAAGSGDPAILSQSDKLARYVCAVELAKQGGHEKCRARRRTSEPCIGLSRSVSLNGQSAPPVVSEGQATNGDGTGGTAQDGSEGPPKTMLELAKRTAGASEEQIKKAQDAVKNSANSAGEKLERAGEAMGGAVKKSWNCLASLFKEC
jgi:hypothetical protein